MSNTEKMGPWQWSRNNWRSIARVAAFTFGWLVVILPLVVIFVAAADTVFNYNGAQPPWWFVEWVGLSLTVLIMGPLLYISIRELRPDGETNAE